MVVFPFPITNDTLLDCVDSRSPFVCEILGVATFMLWASFNPRCYLGATWLEFMRGVLDDLYRIVRGDDTIGYSVFTANHPIILVTGMWFAWQVEANPAGA